jgi:FKBP-type peptidyl-prolyl cis-trans isomerase
VSVKNNGQRIFILVIVVVFFLTALGSSGLVLWDQLSNKDSKDVSSEIQKQLEEQSKKKENTLEGTKLANYTPVQKVEKLEIIDTKVGEGEAVQPGATVTAHYTGALAKDGTIFQSSHDMGNPIPFSLSGVIKGWTDGVPGMKVGGIRRLIIPAEQAYGAQSPSPNIPPNSDLVFDIELVKIGE